MFEVYGFEGAFVQVQAVLTLYSQGLLSGLVLDSGDGVTHAVPVVEGFCFPHLTRRLDLAGRHVTAYLLDLLVSVCCACACAANVLPSHMLVCSLARSSGKGRHGADASLLRALVLVALG